MIAPAPLDRRHRALLTWLISCANRNEVCPIGPAIAERFGISASAVGGMLDRLTAAGEIVVERLSAGRVVTITATGRSTAHPNPITPPRTARGRIGASA